MRLPRLRPSLPLRFTQGFDSGLRLAMTRPFRHCEEHSDEAISWCLLEEILRSSFWEGLPQNDGLFS